MVRTLLAAALLVIAPGATAQTAAPATWPLRAQGDLSFHVDRASFRGSEGKSLLEFYLLIDARQLHFVPESQRHLAQMDLVLTLTDSAGAKATEAAWTRNLSIGSPAQLEEGGFPYRDVIGVEVAAGTYELLLSIEDIYGDRKGTVSGTVLVGSFTPGELKASDVVIAASLLPGKDPGKFTKFGYEVIPNTTRTHLVGTPLDIYFELYHLSEGKDEKSKSLILGYSLKDTNDVVVRSYPAVRVIKPGESAVKTAQLDTKDIEPGRYVVEVEAFDPGTRQHVRSRRTVSLATADSGPRAGEMTEEEQQQLRYYQSIRVLASEADLKVYASLAGEEAKMKFLRAFWKKHDPTPETPINEKLIEHIRRMRHADESFPGRPGQPGSETDRGRVFVVYGQPDDVERSVVSADESRPYEVWHYGRYDFVFQDRNALGIYELVHSTYPGELSNPMWNQF